MSNTTEPRVDTPPQVETSIPEMPFPATRTVTIPPKSAVLAGFLSVFPGLGQAYLGYYKHAFIHMFVFSGTLTVVAQADSDALLPLLPLFLFFYWAYNVIDAVRKATIYNRLLEGGDMDPLPEEGLTPNIKGSLPGGILLILAGMVALSNTAFDYSLQWLQDWWPLGPILFGAYLIFLDRTDKQK